MKDLKEIVEEATDPNNLKEVEGERFITSKTWKKRAKELSPVLPPKKEKGREFYKLINKYLKEEVIDLRRIRTNRSKRTKEIVEKNKELFPVLGEPRREKKRFKYQEIHEESKQVFLSDWMLNYYNDERETLVERMEALKEVGENEGLRKGELSEGERKFLDQLVDIGYLSYHSIPSERKNQSLKLSGGVLASLGLIPITLGIFWGSVYSIIGGGITSLIGTSIFKVTDPKEGPFRFGKYELNPEIEALLEKLPYNL